MKYNRKFAGILINVRSLYNVGSIFRTADGAGFSKLYLAGITPTPLDPFGHARKELQKVALGAERAVQWEHAHSAVRLIKKLKKEGWKIYALEQAVNSVHYARSGRAPKKVALVVGAEVKGLPQNILALADKVLEIPMHGAKESLNVSVAFGVVAYALREA